MGRKVLSLSLPQNLYNEYQRLAQRNGKTKSELFREMIRKYREDQLIEDFKTLQGYGAKKAKKLGIKTEKDVIRLIHESRGV